MSEQNIEDWNKKIVKLQHFIINCDNVKEYLKKEFPDGCSNVNEFDCGDRCMLHNIPHGTIDKALCRIFSEWE